MKYLLYLLFFIQFQNCKSETNAESKSSSNKVEKLTQENYSINSVDKNAIGEKIKEVNKIKELKIILENSFERQIERPYMQDIFVSSIDTLLQFYNYKQFIINHMKFKSYYIKIDYEDGDYESILFVKESLDTEYNSMIVYEKLVSEVNYSRNTKITGDRVQIIFKSPWQSENLDFQVKGGLFLDFFDTQIVNKNWEKKIRSRSSNEFFEYKLEGKTNNHLKNGYWVEKRYVFEYDKIVIVNGNYINGLRDGEWYFSPEGPLDATKVFDKGRFVSKRYR